MYPDSKVHGANMGLTWILSAPCGPHKRCYQVAIYAISVHWMHRRIEDSFCSHSDTYTYALVRKPITVYIQRYISNLQTTLFFHLNIAFYYPRPVLAFGYFHCLCLSVCPCVCVSITCFVRAITRHPFTLGSPNLDQRCKIPWLRSLLFFFFFFSFFWWW